jgi:hypothetical protein
MAAVMRTLALVAPAVPLLLTGCSPIVSLTPAPQATAVACAGVVVRLPDQLLTERKRETDAQATAAWGEPVRVSLRCGVASTPPSSQCVSFDEVDWKVQSTRAGSKQQYVLTTYGRSPVVQVVLDAGLPSDQVMPPISDAIAAAIPKATLHCTIQGDVTPTPTP